MNEFLKIAILCISLGLVNNCSKVLQTVDLEIDSKDNSLQEEFNVVEKTLTIKEAKSQKNSLYPRTVLKDGRGSNAQPIPEETALISQFPDKQRKLSTKLVLVTPLRFQD